MKIISCHIENFGKLHDYTINFSEGVNIICKENGWGKSTLAAFIKIMFYGFDGERKKTIEGNERIRYKPWRKGKFGGQLIFELNGAQYKVTRVFNRLPSEDTFELRDLKTDKIYHYDGKTPNSLGERIFKVDRESFMRTVFISQNACFTSTTGNINAKISNLIDSTDDINNFETACSTLTKAINRLNRNRASVIPKREEEIKQLSRSIEDSGNITQLMEECRNKLNASEKRYAELKNELKSESQQNNLVVKNDSAEMIKPTATPPLMKMGIGLAIIGIVATVLVSNMTIKILSGVCTILIIIALLLKPEKTISEPPKIEGQPTQPLSRITKISEEIERLKDDMNACNNELKELQSKYDELESNKNKLAALKAKQAEDIKKCNYLIKAREKLIAAKDNITAEYAEPLLKSFCNYYKLLTDKDAAAFHIDSNFNVTRNESGEQRDINTQSTGYKDLIWICLRIALVEAIYKDETPVLIMDDPFTNFDDDKIALGMKLLKNIAEKYQIVYFTCSNSRS